MSQKKWKKEIKSKIAENFKSCRYSQKLPKTSKAAEAAAQLVAKPIAWTHLWLSKISLPRFLCVKKKVQIQMQKVFG